MPGWEKLKQLVSDEFVQLKEEGRDSAALEALRPEFAAAGDDRQKLEAVLAKLAAVPARPDFPFDEPSDLPSIRRLRKAAPETTPLRLVSARLDDQMLGAWLGRCAGCALGKPVEGFMTPHEGLSSKQRMKLYLEAVGPDEYPLNFYFPEHSPAEPKTGRTWCPASTREHIRFMESDDDIRYTVIGQIILREKSKDFTTDDVARAWLQYLPYAYVCTAETQAYRNLVERYEFHARQHWTGESADAAWLGIATHLNPYREWIGAQIRADSWGYAAPGNPELAAEFAWRDARISHVKNGIYGEMFCAAMIAAAFAADQPIQIIHAGLAQIPASSRLYSEMNQVIEICRKHGNDFQNFEPVLDDIYALLGHYHPVHTNNNAALVVAALLLGKHDLEKVITLAVMGGWDSDCNGATAGSIAGAMLGAKRLPAKWTDPLHDTLNASLIDYHPIAITECARRSSEIARKIMS